jgi:hypothetical protein
MRVIQAHWTGWESGGIRPSEIHEILNSESLTLSHSYPVSVLIFRYVVSTTLS